MSSNKVETEAKFAVPDRATFSALQQLTRLGDFELEPDEVEPLMDRYLDTADKRLFQAGFACRVRRHPGKQSLTLKALTPAEGSIHRRHEVQVELPLDWAPAEQPEHWPEGPAREMVVGLVGPAPLQTLFTLYQTRHVYNARRQGQPVIEFSLDEVSLADPATVDAFELEAELIEAGSEADLAAFIGALQAQWSLPGESRSKFERAWRRWAQAE